MRRLALVVFVCVSALALGAAPSSAAKPPPLKRAFAPLNLQIKNIGNDIGRTLNAAGDETDVQLAKQFAGLARRAAAATTAVGKLKGAKGTRLILQRNLQLALAQGAIDLADVSTAASAHSVSKAKAATLALIKDSAPITKARTAFAKALGIRA
jgi:hypothetical protein